MVGLKIILLICVVIIVNQQDIYNNREFFTQEQQQQQQQQQGNEGDRCQSDDDCRKPLTCDNPNPKNLYAPKRCTLKGESGKRLLIFILVPFLIFVLRMLVTKKWS